MFPDTTKRRVNRLEGLLVESQLIAGGALTEPDIRRLTAEQAYRWCARVFEQERQGGDIAESLIETALRRVSDADLLRLAALEDP